MITNALTSRCAMKSASQIMIATRHCAALKGIAHIKLCAKEISKREMCAVETMNAFLTIA
jgi:hypothetical protein